MNLIEQGCVNPSWSVQTWGPGDHNIGGQSDEWQTKPYPTLDEAMMAFVSSPQSSKARLIFSDEIGMYTDPSDEVDCTLSADDVKAMLDSHERVYQRLLAKLTHSGESAAL